MSEDDSKVIVDSRTRDWGTRFVPDPRRSPTDHLGGMPTVVEDAGPKELDKPLPPYDETKAVVPPANLPYEKLIQAMVDKVFTDKEKEKVLREAGIEAGLSTANPSPTPDTAASK